MAVTFDLATTANINSGGGGGSFAHTVTASGGNRVLIVSIGSSPTGGSVTAVSYNGVAMTLVRTDHGAASGLDVGSWVLVNPATGSHTVAITATADVHGAVAQTFLNVDQTTPTGGGATADAASGGTATVNQTSTLATDLVIDAMLKGSTTAATVGAGQTAMSNFNCGTPNRKMATSYEPGNAGTVTMSWTFSSVAWTTHTFRLLNSDFAPAGGISKLASQGVG